jgi:hypothetical protein
MNFLTNFIIGFLLVSLSIITFLLLIANVFLFISFTSDLYKKYLKKEIKFIDIINLLLSSLSVFILSNSLYKLLTFWSAK